jgi:hypothetical protein
LAAAAVLAAALAAASCSWNVKGENFKVNFSESGAGPWHRGILATCFWVGEPGNERSAWDPRWVTSFGGVDDPENRAGFLPAGFVPALNAFYCALPYNDVAGRPDAKSGLKGRWVEVRAGGRSCYCQWEDVGPWRTDDREYVLGGSRPRAEAQGKAGIDLSPAVRDYLGLSGRDLVDWRLVKAEGVPAGPWKRVITDAGSGTYTMRRR